MELIYHNTGHIYLPSRSGIESDGSVSLKASPAVIHAPRQQPRGGGGGGGILQAAILMGYSQKLCFN